MTFCAYRGENGTKCAVGCLIPDERYDPNIEGKHASSVEVQNALPPEVRATAAPRMLGLLSDLQQVHDYAEPAQWQGALSGIARCYGLEMRA